MATVRQRKAMANVLVNGGNVSKAMKDAGYSPSASNKPYVLTRSEGFAKLLDEIGVTDKVLAETLQNGLRAKRTGKFGEQVDYAVRHQYLETGLRLKGLGQQAAGVNINFNNYATDQRSQYNLS